MNKDQRNGLLIAVAMIFPFVADHSGLWSAVLGTGQLSTIVLTVYTLTLIAIVATLLYKTTVLEQREKWIWTACLVLAFPLATLGLIYRLYWNPPSS
ncbi:MAG: hypothetical protein ACR2QG_09485 [Gammaproteobacteria bacterium]